MTLTSKQKFLQQERLKTTRLTILGSFGQALLVALFAWTGNVSWTVAAWFAVVGLGTTSLFYLGIRRGWNLPFRDRWLLWAQLLANYAIQLAFIVAAPRLWFLFLASSMVSFNYAMLGFTPRQFRWTWLGYGATTALALFIGRDRFAYPELDGINLALVWLFFFLAIRRLSLIGIQFGSLRDQLAERNRQLTLSLERIQELASQDELTGVFNRRRFMELLADERERAHRSGQPYSLALFDLDHFKSINDRFGHAAGDAVLRDFCTLVQAHMRVTDRFARWGGEEFVLLMPAATPMEGALLAVERIRGAVAAHDWSALPSDLRVTMSSGIATAVPGEAAEALIARADGALYRAKEGGRNCSVMAPA